MPVLQFWWQTYFCSLHISLMRHLLHICPSQGSSFPKKGRFSWSGARALGLYKPLKQQSLWLWALKTTCRRNKKYIWLHWRNRDRWSRRQRPLKCCAPVWDSNKSTIVSPGRGGTKHLYSWMRLRGGLLKNSSGANCQYQDLNLRVVHWAHWCPQPPRQINLQEFTTQGRREIQFLYRNHHNTLEDAQTTTRIVPG